MAFVFGYPLVRIFEFINSRWYAELDGPWIGMRNYQLVLSQDLSSGNRWCTILQLLLAIPMMVLISLLISILLYERIAGWKLYRIIVFVPFVLAIPIIAVVMKRMFPVQRAGERSAALAEPRLPSPSTGSAPPRSRCGL